MKILLVSANYICMRSKRAFGTLGDILGFDDNHYGFNCFYVYYLKDYMPNCHRLLMICCFFRSGVQAKVIRLFIIQPIHIINFIIYYNWILTFSEPAAPVEEHRLQKRFIDMSQTFGSFSSGPGISRIRTKRRYTLLYCIVIGLFFRINLDCFLHSLK